MFDLEAVLEVMQLELVLLNKRKWNNNSVLLLMQIVEKRDNILILKESIRLSQDYHIHSNTHNTLKLM